MPSIEYTLLVKKVLITPEDILSLQEPREQLEAIKQYTGKLSERELVVIATRSESETAGYILNNCPLSLEASAAIGSHHPDLILPSIH